MGWSSETSLEICFTHFPAFSRSQSHGFRIIPFQWNSDGSNQRICLLMFCQLGLNTLGESHHPIVSPKIETTFFLKKKPLGFICLKSSGWMTFWPGSSSGSSLIFWLVVGPPLWKIWKSIGMMTFPIYGKIKNVPNHQPVLVFLFHSCQPILSFLAGSRGWFGAIHYHLPVERGDPLHQQTCGRGASGSTEFRELSTPRCRVSSSLSLFTLQ